MDNERLIEPDPEDVEDEVPAAAEAEAEAQPEIAEQVGTEPTPSAGADLERLAADPDAVARLLTSDAGQEVLDQVVSELLDETEAQIQAVQQQAAVEEQRKRVVTSLQEAYRKGVEEGDWSEYGELKAQLDRQAAALQLLEQRLRPRIAQEVGSQIAAEMVRTVDEAVEAAFGDTLNKFSPEELQRLHRSNFQSDAEFYAVTLTAIREKLIAELRAEMEGEVGAARQAMSAAATASKARADGLGVLPGGIEAKRAGAVSIGDLVRSALSVGNEDDSD